MGRCELSFAGTARGHLGLADAVGRRHLIPGGPMDGGQALKQLRSCCVVADLGEEGERVVAAFDRAIVFSERVVR